jgi:hypothetical protein
LLRGFLVVVVVVGVARRVAFGKLTKLELSEIRRRG